MKRNFFASLEKYSLYEVAVTASTRVGEGKRTSNEFRTGEDSKFFSCSIFLQYI